MNIQQYLERINYAGPVEPTPEVLSNLQLAHLLTVPFENLDIHNHTKIDLSNLFNKVVVRKRGGFCYELNGVFYELLKEIGFVVKMVSARVYDGKGDYYPEFDHLALIVKINEEQYLADVGFGEFAFYPVNIVLDRDMEDPRGIFRLEAFDEHYTLISRKDAGGPFIPQYIFTGTERRLAEFEDRCTYHQTSAESHFTQKRICSLPTKTGRITLTGDTLKIKENGNITERKLNNEQEIRQELWHYFGIKLD